MTQYPGLSLGDVLALRRAPALAVLSACESVGPNASGVGLAQAFIVAGSRTVVAASRKVGGELAARVTAALYGALGSDLDLAAALREAQRAVWRVAPEEDWAAFRVLVP